jgi:predicted methyltransferase
VRTGWPDIVVAAIMAALALQGATVVIRQSVVPAGVLAAVGIKPGIKVIDLCSGGGWFTLQISKSRGMSPPSILIQDCWTWRATV